MLAGFFVWGLQGGRDPRFVPSAMIDEPIPDFEFPGGPLLGDRGFGAADLKLGQVVVINFFASWCVPCREALPAMDRMYRQYKHQGLEVLAVSVDEDPNDALSIVAQLRPRFEIAWDPYGDVQTEFGVNTLPTTVLLDERGEILLRLIGYTEENHQLLVHQVNMLLQP